MAAPAMVQAAPPIRRLAGVAELSSRYPVWLCDVWGVVHDGRAAHGQAVAALERHRRAGGAVVLITNAPRPATAIVPQLARFGVPRAAYDAIVSSGDVTRRLAEVRAGQALHHIGPAEDAPLLDGLPVRFTRLEDANAVLCTGLNRDGRHGETAEHPDDYLPMLRAMRARDLPLICANPDLVVGVGGRLVPCAGALAALYGSLGGPVEMAGKPFAPIYRAALAAASRLRGGPVAAAGVLAIGDGIPTDMAGAAANGLAALYVADGIHAAEIADEAGLAARLAAAAPGLELTGVIGGLAW